MERLPIADVMALPSAQTTVRWSVARSDLDQRQIHDLAKFYFKPPERDEIARVLGRTNFVFDHAEAQELKTKLLALTGAVQSMHLIQFYDYVFTIDNLKNIMRVLYSYVINNKDLAESQFQTLETEIMYPDMIPAFLSAVQDNIKEFYSITGNDIYMHTGNPAVAAAPNHEPKNYLNRSVDEAVFLKSAILQTIQALSQGLFVVHYTSGSKLVRTNNRQLQDAPKVPLVPGDWANAMVAEDGTPVRSLKLFSGMADFNQNYDRDTERNVFKWKVAPTTTVLQPKFTNYEAYDGYLTNHGDPHTAAGRLHRADLPPTEMSISEKGGAIPYYVLIHTGSNIPQGVQPVLHITPENIRRIMSDNKEHPISACPDLATAYAKSGFHQPIMDMLLHLQRALEAAKKQRAARQASQVFSVDQLAILKQVGTTVPQCGPGMTVQFYKQAIDPQGNKQLVPIPDEEALVVRDGQLELSAHVAREKIECVPRITVAQLAAKQTRDNIQFRPIIVPSETPVSKVTAAEAAPRPDLSKIREFHVDPTPRDVYGASMSAYVVSGSQG